MSFYKLIQGDSLKYIPKLEKNSIDLIIVDPPYNIGEVYWDKRYDFLEFMEKIIIEMKRVLKNSGSLYIFTSRQLNRKIANLLDEYFIEQRIIIWVRKRMFDKTRGSALASGYEPICYYTKSDNFTFNTIKVKPEPRLQNRREYKGFLKGRINLSDVWKDIYALSHNAQEKTDHPTQKPEKLIERMIKLSSNKDDLILDAFMGSGTTMKVAQDLGRSCIGIEINPEYCEIIKKRCFSRRFLDREVNYEFDIT